MTDTMVRVFVDARALDVPSGATALDAVRAFDAATASRVEAGERVIVDSRGLPADAAMPVVQGAIFRIVKAR